MAAAAWLFYDTFKRYLGTNAITLPGAFRMSLHTSASNASTKTLSIFNELDNEVTEANGYSSSGKAISAEAWTAGDSAGEMRFDCTALVWTAAGGAIADVKFAVISQSAAASANRMLMCWSKLSTSQFSISSGNTLTITPSANGIFELA
jgi:hypothetical protein